MKANELKRGEWFVSHVEISEWNKVQYRRCPALGFCGRAKRWAEPLHVLAACEYSENATLIAEMLAGLPHASTHQLSSGDSAWVVGRKIGGGRVVLTHVFLRCYSPEGRLAYVERGRG